MMDVWPEAFWQRQKNPHGLSQRRSTLKFNLLTRRLRGVVVSLNWWKSYKASAAVERFYYQPTMQPPLIYYRS
jgi:hypothetical protein